MYKMYDLMCAPSLIGCYDSLSELKKAAREYDQECEGGWWPKFAKLERNEWMEKFYKF